HLYATIDPMCSGHTRPKPAGCQPAVPGRPSVQTIQRGRVPARDERPLLGRHIPEVLFQRLAGLRPGAVGMRVVGRPHYIVKTGALAGGDAREIADEGRVTLTVPVRARLLGEDRLAPGAGLLDRTAPTHDQLGEPPAP